MCFQQSMLSRVETHISILFIKTAIESATTEETLAGQQPRKPVEGVV
jgi:hypothetical protein